MFKQKRPKKPSRLLAIMTAKDKGVYFFFICLWIAVNLKFWSWWFQPAHIVSPVMFFIMSLALFYESSLLPSFFLFFLSQMRRPKHIKPQPGLKVALVTLCVPSKESQAVIRRQLVAMKAVRYPHESWILDEEADNQVKALAKRYGVKYFTRKRVARYNQPGPPFQEKTKAGNVNAWLDSHGKKYQFFTQFDIDHNPIPNYLHRVLGHFRDPKVAWVQAPSIYGNFKYWTARGSAEQELVLQGPLQMGFYGFSETPFIIGSHSTYRTKAVLLIGGFQPTRAEDHLDTVVLSGAGYKGVFVPESIAVGDGPENFETYLGQQFAWAYSMIQVLIHHTPKYFRRYPGKRKLQFLFAQTWYPFWAGSMGLLFILPILALLINKPIASMSFIQTLVLYLPLQLVAFGVWFWNLKKGWFRPQNLSLSWRGMILHIARWPVVLWALINVILGIKKPYMITSKGVNSGEARPFRLTSQIPYLGLIGLSLLGTWFFIWQTGQSEAQGYLLFTLQGAIIMLSVYTVALVMNIREMVLEGITRFRALNLHLRPLLLFSGLTTSVFLTSYLSLGPITQAITWKPPTNQTRAENFKPEKVLIANEPDIYTVKKGDSLWQIADQIYQDGSQWKEIAAANKLKDPNFIHPGEKLII
jgi:cellulose synthase (UDP-forming)